MVDLEKVNKSIPLLPHLANKEIKFKMSINPSSKVLSNGKHHISIYRPN
jgi:hypothetical protein